MTTHQPSDEAVARKIIEIIGALSYQNIQNEVEIEKLQVVIATKMAEVQKLNGEKRDLESHLFDAQLEIEKLKEVSCKKCVRKRKLQSSSD